MSIISVTIKITSRETIVFRQRRYGLDEREIHVWKYRATTVCEDDKQVYQAKSVDARVTKFGEFLRRWSLDKLPQLFNVLEGSMSMIGTRPHATAHDETYPPPIQGYMLRY